MKNILYLFFVIALLGCGSDDDDSSNNPNNNPYFFEIELGGETHEIRGNTAEDNFGLGSLNKGYVLGQQLIQFTIGDKSADNYISGQNLSISMGVNNMSIGNNSGSLNFVSAGTYFTDYMESIGVNFFWGFSENQGTSATSSNLLYNISNIMITDLGTASSTWNQDGCNAPFGGTCYGENVEGSYESVLYFIEGGTNLVYSIPVPIKIRFSLPRIN